MKIKLLIVVITFVVLAALGATSFYIYKILNRPAGSTALPAETEENSENQSAGEEALKETRILKEDFEMTLPPGWQEADTPPEGIWLMAIDAKENISAGIFQKLDFRTNLSVKSDDIAKYAGVSSFEDYVASVKTSLVQTISSISFDQEEQKTINGLRAILLECSSRQEEADFKTLIVFVKASDNIIYALSFNSFKDSWPTYKNLFYWVADSFKLKYKMEL